MSVYYRCKCGESEWWSSGYPPHACTGCHRCGTNLTTAPSLHEPPAAHDFSLTTYIETDEGPKPLSRCKWCLRTRGEIAKRELAEAKLRAAST